MTQALKKIHKNRQKLKTQKQIEIEDRRVEVFALRGRGRHPREIAKELGVSEGTVRGDLKEIRKENVELVSDYKNNEFIGEFSRHFEVLINRAWADYEEANVGSPTRAKFLGLIRTLRKDQYDVFRDVGLVRPVDEGKGGGEETTKIDISVLDQLPGDVRQILIRTVIQKQTPTVLQEPEPNPVAVRNAKVIDVKEEQLTKKEAKLLDAELDDEALWEDDEDDDAEWDEEGGDDEEKWVD